MNMKAEKAAKLIGSNGGKARAIKLSPERRKEIAIHAAKARWKDHIKYDPVDRGPYSLPPGTDRLTCRFANETIEKLVKIANEQGVSVSELVNGMVMLGIEHSKYGGGNK